LNTIPVGREFTGLVVILSTLWGDSAVTKTEFRGGTYPAAMPMSMYPALILAEIDSNMRWDE
jgi:hypothetical protein